MTEAEMAPAAPAIVSAAEELLAWGDQHPSRRVQTLAERARTALADLAHTQDKEKAVSAAEARVQRLQEQLAKAQAELRDAKGPGAAPEATPKAPKRSKEESLRIRQWARENGHECPTAGIIPQHIVGAYEVARVPRLAVAG